MHCLLDSSQAGLILRLNAEAQFHAKTSARVCATLSCVEGLPDGNRLPRMAPNLAESQHEEICDMILSRSLNAVQTAEVAGYSDRSICAIRSNLRYFGTTKSSSNDVGQPRSITPPMLDALCERLLEKPDLY